MTSVDSGVPEEADATLVARDLVGALVAAGVRHVVLAPGSRSAPLAYAALHAERAGLLRLHVRVDERVAGFVALGLAKAGAGPVVVITTSGTAVANLHPAVLEADHAGLPVIVVSADRPHELRGTGANQTTVQPGIFAGAPRWSAEIPAGPAPTRQIAQQAARAVAAATGSRSGHPGPVHLNVAFREPLTPHHPWHAAPVDVPDVDAGTVTREPVRLAHGPRTVVVAGDGAGPAARRLAERAGWPLLAEPSSGARGGPAEVPAYRAVLEVLAEEVERVVVHGHPTLSRPVTGLLSREDLEVVVVAPGGAPWADVAGAAARVAAAVDVEREAPDGPHAWLERWRRAGRAAHAVIAGAPGDGLGSADPGRRRAEGRGELAGASSLDGLAVARLLAEGLGGEPLVVGSSLAIRDLDLVASPWSPDQVVYANRGLAGIDGTISTATGVALAGGGPVRVLLGDLTFVHDVGGLARGVLEEEVDLQVIVLNDDGGGIFATLEHGRQQDSGAFERVFGTPQQVDVGALATGFGAGHVAVRTAQELTAVLSAPVTGRQVVEVLLDRGDLGPRRRAVLADAAAAARATLS